MGIVVLDNSFIYYRGKALNIHQARHIERKRKIQQQNKLQRTNCIDQITNIIINIHTEFKSMNNI